MQDRKFSRLGAYIQKKIIMNELSDKQKRIFEDNVKKISRKDEEKVLSQIGKEIEKLKGLVEKKASVKIENLISDTELLLSMLDAKDFPLSESSRKWVIFALNYLVSDFDLIPDSIPNIGYYDDALIVAWVKNLLDNDITRFEIYKKAERLGKGGKVIKNMIQGEGQSEVIILPGLYSNENYTDLYAKWIQNIKQSRLGQDKPAISFLNWKTNYTPELEKTLLLVEHDLNLHPACDYEKFQIEWEQVKKDFKHLSHAFFQNIQNIKKQTPDKKIIVIAMNAGTYVLDNHKNENLLKLIDEYYILGGCSSSQMLFDVCAKNIKRIYNYYNSNDSTLKFVFDNFENQQTPIGLAVSTDFSNNRIKNIDLAGRLKKHSEYRDRFKDYI